LTDPAPVSIATSRLDLVPLTRALAAAERAGPLSLGGALEALVPPDWPPEYYELDDLDRMERLLRDDGNAGWTLFYLIERSPRRTLVGVAGSGGRPTPQGVVEIGYGVVPAFRRRGIATEAVTALVEFAFHDLAVTAVAAETFPHLEGSIGVLRRAGFERLPDPGRNGTIRFQCSRSPAAAR
jgi:RimJ/RimL family protein N-acetyltransferase